MAYEGGMKADLVNVGMRFGRWLVEASPQIDGKHWKAGCLCDCGRRAQVRVYRLLVGKSKSCGCLVKDIYTKHGMTRRGSHAPEYAVWNAVIARTTRPNTRNFADYGGRGIGVCESWMTFANFIADIGQRPTPKHTLERIDNSKGYSPENCRWATRLEQGNNKRNNRPITAAGKTQNLTQWARDLGCCTATILGRIKLGWPEDRAVLTPPRKMHRRK